MIKRAPSSLNTTAATAHLAVDNPRRTKSAALNLGIRIARGDTIIRIDAHSFVAHDYIRRCEQASLTHDAGNVGGEMITVAQMITVPGGGRRHSACDRSRYQPSIWRGNSSFRTGAARPAYVDTAFGGCYNAKTIAKIGWFNEALIHSQDIDYNIRLRRAGNKIVLLPDLVCYYYARPDLRSFCRLNSRNGLWTFLAMWVSEFWPSWRHLVPALFVVALLSTSLLALASSLAAWVLLVIVAVYTVANASASFQIGWRQRSRLLGLVIPMIFVLLHLACGLRSICGLVRVAISVFARSSRTSTIGQQIQPE